MPLLAVALCLLASKLLVQAGALLGLRRLKQRRSVVLLTDVGASKDCLVLSAVFFVLSKARQHFPV
jgi:hypothetical protein